MAIKIDPDAIYPPTETAALLGMKPQTLAVRRLKGTGPRFTKAGRNVLYFGRDLISFLEHGCRSSTSDEVSAVAHSPRRVARRPYAASTPKASEHVREVVPIEAFEKKLAGA